MTKAIERSSPCKVNLILNVLGRRPDGFHEIETVFHPVPVFDRLRFEMVSAPGIHLACNVPGLPTDRRNLVYRAAAAFLTTASPPQGVQIRLEKQLPLAAGLGGGSANAATTLLALNQLFGNPLSADQLAAIARTLGSDVPFFLQDQPALGLGRGEIIQPLGPFPALAGAWIVLAHPGFGVPTPWAYAQLASAPALSYGEPGRAQRLIRALQTGTIEEAAPLFANTLELPVMRKYPLLALIREDWLDAGAPVALMSGSGSTVFALAIGPSLAELLAERCMRRFGPALWTAIAPLA
ncbi:MAG TPA: 4-(cytidine 5'-diphospho)-2-C-methyl-D-erythritol kinase [Candidatus Paceibacterota bacterium]|nr:4-(cytidine 5'-diphospho)-2-C-methyl-D-erythritol kinase [Verrucomicrobiota bacterium]HRZ45300.1 4-(cytidine 5'-diphospho)-2-C-methyl-D-erythritol kinase [Candidatus Paceibacterota bacterium]HRZ91563.1 4-(cytidine 5'-diphospho)-2-C-methyl-D-erythritol kinase [Candidatus Paceibacterota bacterium]